MESQKNWTKYCLDHIIRKMRSDRYGNLFSTPVLEASDSIIPPSIKENYRLVIKNPMDYKTVKNKLENNIYNKPEEFYEDMKLIYDNCMIFNPPTGNSKWAHDAAVSNLKKFTKLWESCSKTVNDLYESSKGLPVDGKTTSKGSKSLPPPINYPVLNMNENYLNQSDLNTARINETYNVTLSQTDNLGFYPEPTSSPALDVPCNFNDGDATPRSKWSFRLNLQSIQEYKLRKGFINQPSEVSSYPDFVDTKSAAEAVAADHATPVSLDVYTSDATNTVDSPNFEVFTDSNINTADAATEFEELESDPVQPMELDLDVPQILSNNDDGVVCVSFLSDNECNRLFPNCNIIGLSPEKPNYNISDVSIRYIYNQLYLNEVNNLKFDQKKETSEEKQSVEEDFMLKDNRPKIKININNLSSSDVNKAEFLIKKGFFEDPMLEDLDTEDYSVEEYSENKGKFTKFIDKLKFKANNVKAFNNGDLNKNGTKLKDRNNTNGHEIKRNYRETKNNGTEMDYAKELDQLGTGSSDQLSPNMDIELSSNKNEVFDLYIDIESNSMLNASDAIAILEKNFFTKVPCKDEYFKICDKPQMFLLCANKGYYKLDDSDFLFRDFNMRHTRIFFFNCSKSKIKVTSRRSTFSELVTDDDSSLVYSLHNEVKLGNESNLTFFTLPKSTPICFSKQQDILYRLQLIHNSLPFQLLALHIISTN